MTAAPSQSSGQASLPALTSVRFFFSLGVVLFHLQLMWAWPTLDYTGLIERARLGVDMFFILSGFVLSHVYAQQVDEGRYSHRRFLIARLARIYPAHLAILLLMVVVALAALMVGERFNPDSYSLLGLVQTALLVHAWFPTDAMIEWNGPSWSLSAEWGAYLLYPAFAFIGLKLRDRPLVLLGVAVAAFALTDIGYRAVFGEALLHGEFKMGVLRIMPLFLAGVALHVIAQRWSLSPPAAIAATLLSTALLLALMHFSADERAVVAAAGVLILALAFLSHAKADGPLAWPWLVFLGEASYAVYLLHLPLLVIWKNARSILLGGDSGYILPGWEIIVLVAMILVGGALIHVVIERPARLWARRRFLSSPPQPPAPAAAGLS